MIHAGTAIMDIATHLARGDQSRAMEYADFYNAWKIGEMQRLVNGDR